ncbi:MAG: hypothetical protein ABJZ55_07280 [Fuerstiella sp.]
MLEALKTSDWVRVTIPFITFGLGLLTAAIVSYFKRKRSIVAWGVISEDSFFTKDVASDINMPVRILVNNEPHDALTAVKLRLGSAGNEIVENPVCVATFNSAAKIFRVRALDQLGEFQKTIKLKQYPGRLEIRFDYLNPEHRQIDFEILFGNYEPGSISVDLSKKGTVLQHREAGKWDVRVSLLQGMALSFAGVRFDPTVSPLSEIAQELRNIKSLVAGEQASEGDPQLLYLAEQKAKTPEPPIESTA